MYVECECKFAIGSGCDPITGQCVCLPGVTGLNCDSCPHNHYLIMNETGPSLQTGNFHSAMRKAASVSYIYYLFDNNFIIDVGSLLLCQLHHREAGRCMQALQL